MDSAKTRILVVDDAVVIRMRLRSLLGADAELEVIGTAKNGRVALECMEEDEPDVVLLDLEMPVMDGLETLEHIKRRFPDVSVILFSSPSARGASATIEALALGAVDFVAKPTSLDGREGDEFRDQLVGAIKLIHRRASPPSAAVERAPSLIRQPKAVAPITPIEIVAIGASTGGPNALAELVPHFGADFPVPIVIVQHMPPVFTGHLARRLSDLSGVTFAEGEDDIVLEPGTGWVAPGGMHMVLQDGVALPRLITNTDEKENSCRPAVDPMMRSVAREFGDRCLAVILTGMGSDGMLGCREVKSAGGRIIAQDEESSVVWGMPGFVVRDGLADTVLPLCDIGPTITRWVESSRRGRSQTRT